MKQHQLFLLFVPFLVVIQVDGFRITKVGKLFITINEGEDVEFSCIASGNFQYCAFEHTPSGTICRRRGRTVTDCDAFKNRAEFTEGSNPSVYKKKCKLLLKSVTSEDEGKWTCVLEPYLSKQTAKEDIFLKIIKKSIPNSTEVMTTPQDTLRTVQVHNSKLNKVFLHFLKKNWQKIEDKPC